ncbi:MAG: PD-(D/E)XK nuclease family protein [Desulfobacteraceae bacterium]|nr:MAG: PD-(D/E)XK nuclease family protein [Desulfobacteraceae bacterium]
MHIIFGYELDSASFPDALGQEMACQGTAVLGPHGLLGVVETSLGLSGMQVPQAVRIGQYLKRLREFDDGGRFYSRSMQADAWSVAKQLLTWRDELVIAGWQRGVPKGASPRLRDLTAVEQLHHLELAPGIGDRLNNAIGTLNSTRKLDIQLIQLIEPRLSLPQSWGRLFNALLQCDVRVEEVEKTVFDFADHDISDLNILRRALQGEKPDPGSIRVDGSMTILRGADKYEVSEALASWLEVRDLSKVLIIRGNGSFVLNDALHAHNLPGLGSESRSRWRTALQVLPLILSNHWEPFDPQRLLEILTLPKSPIPRWAARYFEKSLRDHPGIGGPKWKEAWESVVANYQAKASGKEDAALPKGSVEAFQENLSFWLGERRYDPKQGMPTAVIRDICTKVANWASTRGGLENDELLITSAALANAAGDSVAASGLDKVTLPQLNRILDSVMGEGLENPVDFPQAAPWSQVETPGQVWGSADTVVWWNFTSSGVDQRRIPWTLAEREALCSVGVNLEDTRQARLREAGYWRKPVAAAAKQLVLVIPESISGEVAVPHPFWDEIRYLLKLNEAEIQKLSFNAQELWKNHTTKVIDSLINRNSVPEVSIAAPYREWSIPPVCILPREGESASSLFKLIQCPLSWVFQYIAKLYPGDLLALPGVSQILGTLSHFIIETMVSESSKWNPDEAERRALQLYDEYVPKIAAVLDHPGRELEKLRHRQQVGQAVKRLFSLIEAANLQIVGYEVKKERSFIEGKVLEGRIDLILASSEGESIVLDLKWAKKARYKGEELREGKALQLATYGWLLEGEEGRFPAGGYYMLAQGELLVSSCPLFPDPNVIHDVNLEDVWQRSLNAYRHRLKQLQNGLALAEGIEDFAESESPTEKQEIAEVEDSLELGARCEWCAFLNLCGARG